MSAVSKFLDKKLLRLLEPLDQLSADKLDEIISKSTVENLPAGRTLFRQGERDSNVLYLLSGQLELTELGSTRVDLVKARPNESQGPLLNQLPRPCTAKTKTASSVLAIDSSLLELLLDDNPSGEYEVTELSMTDEATDWMMIFLQSRAFLNMPTDNIQKLLMRMEEVPVKAGQQIIKQGEKGDYYYVVNQGQCTVSRRPAPSAEEIPLAELSIGSGFGEEALITDGTRNASVTMLTDGVLMRLAKKDFLDILVEPLQQTINIKSVNKQGKQAATIIDVRTKTKFEQGSLPGAINIPLSMLRLRMPSLKPGNSYITYSDSGKDSAAAAFLLKQNGFDCQVVKGSLAKSDANKVANKKSAQTAAKTKPAAKPKTKQNKTPKSVQRLHEVADQIHQQADQLVSKTDHHSPATATDVETAQPDPLQMARKESEKILAEANNIKQAALKEASRMREAISTNVTKLEAEETARLKLQLARTRSRAEDEIRKTEQQAKETRKQAELERQEIIQQARAEAEQLKAELMSLREKADQEQLEIKQQLENELEHARQQALEEARHEAEQTAAAESRQIIDQARKEAEQLKSEIKSLRDMAEQEQDDIKLKIEAEIQAVKQRAEQETRQRAEQEAKQESRQIIEQARLEAEQLTAEIQSLKDKAEQEQLAIQNRIEEEISTVKQRAAEEARQLAEKEAMEIRKNAMAEAEQVKQALQHTRKILEQTATEEKQPAISHNNVFDLEEDMAADKPVAKPKVLSADEESARQMAIEIKKRLSETEEKRQEEEIKQKVVKSSLRKLDDRIILETDMDLFVFKFPTGEKETSEDKPQTSATVTPFPVADRNADTDTNTVTESTQAADSTEAMAEDVSSVKENQSQSQEQSENEPSENVADFDLVIKPNHEIERYAYQERNRKKSIWAVAASILLIITLSTVAYTTKIQLNFTEVLATGKSRIPVAPDTIEDAEKKIRYDAEQEFKRKLASLK